MSLRWVLPEHAAEAAAVSQQHGAAWHVPLFAAAARQLIDLGLVIEHGATLPIVALEKATRPVIILVCDDGAQPRGPDGWRCTRQAAEWAAAALVHAAGGNQEHYAEAVQAALLVQRLLIVDTASRHAAAWASRLRHRPTMIRTTAAGASHPIPETMH